MPGPPNHPPTRKFFLVIASAASVVLLVVGSTADFFELSSKLGWWRLFLLVAIISLLAGAIAGMREIRRLWLEVASIRRKRDVDYLAAPADVFTRAARLLDESTISLEYYGGINLINADAGEEDGDNSKNLAWWRNSLSKRLKQDGFSVTRYIDFLLPSEMAALYDDQHVPLRQIRQQVEEYTKWIETQEKALATGAAGNAFYNLRGAPIWQWGMHVLVFDRRHVMLVFANTRRNYRALVLSNDPETATDIHEAFVAWHQNLKRRPISVEQLQAAVDDGNNWLLTHQENGVVPLHVSSVNERRRSAP